MRATMTTLRPCSVSPRGAPAPERRLHLSREPTRRTQPTGVPSCLSAKDTPMMIRTYVDSDFDQLLDLTVEVFGPFFEESFRPTVGPTIFHHEHADWREAYRKQ